MPSACGYGCKGIRIGDHVLSHRDKLAKAQSQPKLISFGSSPGPGHILEVQTEKELQGGAVTMVSLAYAAGPDAMDLTPLLERLPPGIRHWP